MKLTDSLHRYGPVTQLLHWLSALLAFGLFGLGFWMVDLGYYDDWYHRAPALHISFGLLLAAFTLIRLLWRRVSARTPAPTGNRFIQTGAKVSKLLLYLLLVLLPVTGYLITGADGSGADFFGLWTLPSAASFSNDAVDWLGDVHEWAAWGLVLLALGHALAALHHHFIARDTTLVRMLPFTSTGDQHESD